MREDELAKRSADVDERRCRLPFAPTHPQVDRCVPPTQLVNFRIDGKETADVDERRCRLPR